MLPTVSAYVRSMILNYHDSEDVIQTVAVIFAEKFEGIDPSRDLVPWVLRIARYEVVNHFRAQGRKQKLLDEKVLLRLEQAYRAIHGESEDIKTALHGCIKLLSDRPRHILKLRYFREMDISDISSARKTPIMTSRYLNELLVQIWS